MSETQGPNEEFMQRLSEQMDDESRVAKIIEEVLADLKAEETPQGKEEIINQLKTFVERYDGAQDHLTAGRVAAYKEVIQHFGG